jgi:ornithine carbamoyltransferase
MLNKDFLTLGEISSSQLQLLLGLSSKLKSTRGKAGGNLLKGKSVALLFEKPSTRTRVSFQVATSELGGFPIVLSANETQLGRGETIEDTANVLSRLVHAIMARVNLHEEVVRLAKASSVPVINGLSDLYHPVQILADLLTLKERKGALKGLKVAWVGDGNNVCNSWMYGAALTGVHFHAATPPLYRPLPVVLKDAQTIASSTGSTVTIGDDPIEAVSAADCVITDTFVSMGFDKERDERVKTFLPKYQVNEKLMAHAKKNAIFQHCLPAHRGEEVSSGVIDGPQSVVWEEAENRLHTTKALLCLLMLGNAKSTAVLRSL